MEALAWVDELDTGIPEIDNQHKRIVDYINSLLELRQSPDPDREKLGAVIGETVDYTMSHFAFEETLMENSGYMFFMPHKKVHDLFIRRVSELKSRFDMGEDVTMELHGLLSRWLFNHIRNEDHGYIDAVKTYLRMSSNSQIMQREMLKKEVLAELEQQSKKKGWLRRLFGF